VPTLNPTEYLVLKTYFTAFGKELLAAFAERFESRGLDYTQLTTKQVGKELVEEVKKTLNGLNSEQIDFDEVRQQLINVSVVCWIMYMNTLEKK